MTTTTPLYGIRAPDNTTKVVNLGRELGQMATDVENALAAAQIPPTQPMSIVVAPSVAARDAHWGIPTTDATRRTLQGKGATTIRTDMGWTEQYFAQWNATTNPQGARVAGWYPVSGHMPGGRVSRSTVARTFDNNAWQLLTTISEWVTANAAHGIAAFNGSWAAPMDGIYLVEASVKCDHAVNTILAVKKNDLNVSFSSAIMGAAGFGFAGTALSSVSAEVPLKKGDAIRLGYFTLATALWNTTTPELSYFGISFARPVRAAL